MLAVEPSAKHCTSTPAQHLPARSPPPPFSLLPRHTDQSWAQTPGQKPRRPGRTAGQTAARRILVPAPNSTPPHTPPPPPPARTVSSSSLGATMTRPCRWKLNSTLPGSATLPPLLVMAVRTSLADRLTLSASTHIHVGGAWEHLLWVKCTQQVRSWQWWRATMRPQHREPFHAISQFAHVCSCSGHPPVRHSITKPVPPGP